MSHLIQMLTVTTQGPANGVAGLRKIQMLVITTLLCSVGCQTLSTSQMQTPPQTPAMQTSTTDASPESRVRLMLAGRLASEQQEAVKAKPASSLWERLRTDAND